VQPASPAAQCGLSEGYTLCIEVPDGVLSGDITVSATASGGTKAIAYVEFQWGTKRVLVDFWAPYTFTWQTAKYLDGTAPLKARVVTYPNEVAGSFVSLSATLDNGNVTSVPANPTDWDERFQPRPVTDADPVIAAVGDSADGSATSDAVAASIQAATPHLLLYLGDIYEYGTWPEWLGYYGVSSWDDPNGVGDRWGAMASYTDYTLGNHEARELATWRDYWHGRPNWRAFEYGGVYFLNLNSECALVGGCGVGSPQYTFVEQALAATTKSCVVAYWHRPVLSAVSDTPAMEPLWSLIARNGGDLVLNGHAHTMQAFKPLNASLQAKQPDSHVVELVSGAGAHHFTSAVETDTRAQWHGKNTAGAVYITAVGGAGGAATRLDWEFRDTAGAPVVDAGGTAGSGSVPCENPPPAPPKAEYVFTGSGTTGAFKSHSFTVSSVPKTLSLRLDWDNASADLNVFLKNPAGTTVAFANGSTAKPEVVTYNATTAGTWQANVSFKSGSASYELLVNPTSANQAPTARFTSSCTGLTCSFDGRGSSDSDGTISSYAWEFGDGSTGSGATPTRTYAAAGTYPVKLTVTDNAGATSATTQQVTVTAPATSAEYVFTGSGTTGAFKSHSFTVSSVPKTLYLRLDWDNASADLNLFLKNPAGTTVAYANGGAKPEVVQYTATTTGTWKANVSFKSGSASYELLVNPSG